MKNLSVFVLSIMISVFMPAIALLAQTPSVSLTLDEFEQKLKADGNPQVLDVRTTQEFEENHLYGAISFPSADVAGFDNAVARLDKTKPVFVYSINNGRSTAIARKLSEAGFSEVYQLPGGIAHWLGAGKPVFTKAGKGLKPDEFEKVVSENNLVLVSVASQYCGGCRKLSPVISEVERETADFLKVARIELYDNRELAGFLDIESVPTLILYKNGRAIWTKSGSITKADIQDALDNSL